MSTHQSVIEAVQSVKEHYHFSGDLWGQNVWISLRDTILPGKILPVRNPCYTMPLLVGRLLWEQGVRSRICIAKRGSWKKLLPIHVLLSVDDEDLRRWYVDFVRDGEFVIQEHSPPDASDEILEAWEYRWEDTLSQLLRENSSAYYILLHVRSFMNSIVPKGWMNNRNKRRHQKRADLLNFNKKESQLPQFWIK